MIAKMSKVYVVSRKSDRPALLNALGDLGVIHLTPVDASRAIADEKLSAKIDDCGHALLLLSSLPATDAPADMDAEDIVDEVVQIQRESAEQNNRLSALHRQLAPLEIWGDVQLEQFTQLAEADINIRFFRIDSADIGEIDADCVQIVGQLGDDSVIAVIKRQGELNLPESATAIPLPARDRPSILAEAERIDETLKTAGQRLDVLAGATDAVSKRLAMLKQQESYVIAHRGGLEDENLFAIQGWAPVEQAETLANDLATKGVDAAASITAPDVDEQPPTLVRYPRWVKPIEALFKILGTTPGYREYDLAPFFMLAMPIFVGMLIGDAGYGLIFALIGMTCYGKIVAKAGKPAAQLILVFGVVTMVWGLLSGNIFGLSPNDFAWAAGAGTVLGLPEATGLMASIARGFQSIAVVWTDDAETAMNNVIKISFLIGTIHLVLAHLLQAIGLAPSQRSIAQIGWVAFLIGMLGAVWTMFFPASQLMPMNAVLGLLGAGYGLVVLFSVPCRNPLKRIGLGIATNLLPCIGAFSDTISYIRLMAVGLASYYIAFAFNGLAFTIGSAGSVYIVFSVLIIILAHTLNIILGLIAVFAHGVRLNMLEFSSNANVQWVGQPYAPFANTVVEGDS